MRVRILKIFLPLLMEMLWCFERLVSVRLGRFMERSGVLPSNPVCVSERSGYLRCTFVSLPYTAKCIGE